MTTDDGNRGEASTDYARLGALAERIAALPDGELTAEDVKVPDFFLYRRGDLSIYYAPFDSVNESAHVALVGITPGLTQMRLAFAAARDALREGASLQEASRRAKGTASFAGMRDRLVGWLDDVGLALHLDVASTDVLFADRRDLLHTTSAVRYPTFIGGRNYTGRNPTLTEAPPLRNVVLHRLGPELERVADALVVPLGSAVSGALELLVAEAPARPPPLPARFPAPIGRERPRRASVRAAARQVAVHRSGLVRLTRRWSRS